MEAPLISARARVLAEWADANRHFNSVRYLDLFREGAGVFLRELGVTRTPSGTFFQAEAHIRYERELWVDAPVVVESWLVAIDDKRLHHFHEMRHAEAGYRAATVEYLHLHVDTATRRASPMPLDLVARLRMALAERTTHPDPGDLGRAIRLSALRAKTTP